MTKRRYENESDRQPPEQRNDRDHLGAKKRIKFSPKDTPGVICIERHIHDEAIVISGLLTIKSDAVELNSWIEDEVGAAVREVKERGGIVGQIKAAVTETSTCVITVTDEKTLVKETPQRQVKIMLAAIMFMVDPKEAENIVRRALAGVRTRLRQKERQ